MKQFKILLLASMITLFATYANASVNMAPIISYLLSDSTASLSGLDIIKAYADDQNNPAPTVQDYEDAGVVGVTLENIDDVNGVIAGLTSIDVDTTEKVQTIVDDVNSNTSPIANAGTDQYVETNTITTLDGSLSEDEDNDSLMYSWSFVSVSSGSGLTVLTNPDTINPTFIPDVDGEYNIQLIVNDGITDSIPDTVKVIAANVITPTIQIKSTEQNTSYDVDGIEVTDGSLKDDGFYQTGVTPSYGRDNLNNIVTDHITGLMWQDDVGARTAKGIYSYAIAYCEALSLGGYNDWRVPTIVELQSIILHSKSPSIDTSVFLNCDLTDSFGGQWYWSSDTVVNDTNRAWLVKFTDGIVGNYDRWPSFGRSVRCVR